MARRNGNLAPIVAVATIAALTPLISRSIESGHHASDEPVRTPEPKSAPAWPQQQSRMKATLFYAKLTARDRASHVGQSEWVHPEGARRGAECVIDRGAELALRNSSIVYQTKEGGGTECDDGTSIDMTVAKMKAQNSAFQRFIRGEIDVLSNIVDLPTPADTSVLEDPTWNWVEVIDSPYVDTAENLEYGDVCGAEGTVRQMGILDDGRAVMRVAGPLTDGGTRCPAGTVYLDPATPPGPAGPTPNEVFGPDTFLSITPAR